MSLWRALFLFQLKICVRGSVECIFKNLLKIHCEWIFYVPVTTGKPNLVAFFVFIVTALAFDRLPDNRIVPKNSRPKTVNKEFRSRKVQQHPPRSALLKRRAILAQPSTGRNFYSKECHFKLRASGCNISQQCCIGSCWPTILRPFARG